MKKVTQIEIDENRKMNIKLIGYFRAKFPYQLFLTVPEREQELNYIQNIKHIDFHSEIMRRFRALEGIKIGEQRQDKVYRFDVRIPIAQFQKHCYAIGGTGFGKTTLLNHIIKQLINLGYGVIIFAYEADMINDVTMMITPEREKDFMFINPLDSKRPITYNPFHLYEGENFSLKANDVFTVFNRFFDTSSMPRTEAILKNAISTLTWIGGDLMDMELLFGYKDYRLETVSKLKDDRLKNFWLNKYPSYPKNSDQPILNRVDRFIGDPESPCRNLFCHSESSLDFRKIIEQNKIVLINLADSLIGEENAKLIGQLLFAQIQLSAMARAEIDPGKRKPFFLILDEFQRLLYGSSIETIEQLLSRARKQAFCLLMANQTTKQLDPKILAAILGNVGTLISFALSRSDAELIAKEMNVWKEGELMKLPPELIQLLQVGEAFCRIERNSFFMTTPRFDRQWDMEKIERLKQLSADIYGIEPKQSEHIKIINRKDIILNEPKFRIKEMDVYR